MTLARCLRFLGLGLVMMGITHWSLSLGLISGGVAMYFVARLAEE